MKQWHTQPGGWFVVALSAAADEHAPRISGRIGGKDVPRGWGPFDDEATARNFTESLIPEVLPIVVYVLFSNAAPLSIRKGWVKV